MVPYIQVVSPAMENEEDRTHMIMILTTCLCRFGRLYPLSWRMMDHTETMVANGQLSASVRG